MSHARRDEHQCRVPVDRHLVARIGLLIVDVRSRRRNVLRQASQRRVLPIAVRSSGQESRPGSRYAIASARPVMRVQDRVRAEARHPGQRERVPPQQVVQDVERTLDVAPFRLDLVRDEELQRVIRGNGVRSPHVISARQRDPIRMALCAFDDGVRGCKRSIAEGP